MNPRLIFFLSVLISGNFFGQNSDSLLKIINASGNHDTTRFHAYYELGWELIYSNPDTTYICAKKAFVLAKNSRMKTLQAKALNLMGAYFQIKSDYKQAIDYYQKSLNIALGNKDPNAILVAYGNIGSLYIHLGQLQKALDYQLKSLNIALQAGSRQKLGSIYNNLCLVYSNLGRYDKAIEYGKKSYEVYSEFNDKNGICSSTGNLGNAYMMLKDNDQALKYYNTCYSLSKEIDNPYELSRASIDIAIILINQKKFPEAKKYLIEAENNAETIEDITILRDVYEQYYKLYKASGDIQNALKHFEIFHQIKDTLNQEEKKTEIARKELEFEYNKRMAEDSIRNAEEAKVKDLKIKASKAQIEKDKILKIALGSGLAMVIILGVLIFNRFRITRRQKQIIEIKSKQTEEQKAIIENKNKEILDSINYAKKIQYTLLAHDEFLKDNLKDHFVLFMPKDIVSGDYYWAAKKEDRFYLACCDSTGHGVPGAFMSLLNIGFLNEAIVEKNISDPAEIFNYTRERLINSISKDDQQDGFDGILMCVDYSLNQISYVAANNAPMLISNGRLSELPYDKMPVGKGEVYKSFTKHSVTFSKGDLLYLCTDGYADQFGGPAGKKFKYRQLESLINDTASLPLHEQKTQIEKTFIEWKGKLEQVDDVCIIGIRI